MRSQRSSARGHHFSLKVFWLKGGHNSRNIAFRLMPLVLQLHLAMMNKYSKFGIDTFNTFKIWATLKFLHNNDLAKMTI